MRDPRFDWDPTRHHHLSQRQEGEGLLAGIDLGSVLQAIERWWAVEGESNRQGKLDDAYLQEASRRLKRACEEVSTGPEDLPDSIASALISYPHTPKQIGGHRALGRAIARCLLANEPSAISFDFATQIMRRSWEALDAFHGALIAGLAPATSTEWVKLLSQIPSQPEELLGHYWHRSPVPVEQLKEHELLLKRQGPAAYLWSRENERSMLDLPWTSRGRIVFNLDPPAFLSLLEGLPLRELRLDMLRTLDLHEDRNAIMTMLRLASNGVAEGSWSGNVCALLALDMVSTHAEHLHNVVTRVAQSPVEPERRQAAEVSLETLQAELLEWATAAFLVALARPDGRCLALFTTTHLIAKRSRLPSSSGDRWSSMDIVVSALRKAFVPAISAADLRAAAQLEGRSVSTGKYLVAAGSFDSTADETWEWYVSLLRAHDDDFASHISIGARPWVYGLIGGLLLAGLDPLAQWSAAWGRLFSDRERSRFRIYDIHALQPSQHLVHVGFGLLNRRDRAAKLSDVRAQELWRELRRAVLTLSQGIADDGVVRRFFGATGFEFVMLVFSDEWTQVLDESADWLRTSVVQQIYVSAKLIAGGVSRAAVLAEMASRGFDPLAAIETTWDETRSDHELSWAVGVLRDA